MSSQLAPRYNKQIDFSRPPRSSIRTIAYNGSYWLAGMTEYINTKVVNDRRHLGMISTYTTRLENARIELRYWQLVKKYGEKLYSYNPSSTSLVQNFFPFVDERINLQLSIISQTETDLAQEIQSFASSPTANNTVRSVHTLVISYDGTKWEPANNDPFITQTNIGANYQTSIGGVTSYCSGLAWNGSMWVAVGADVGRKTASDINLKKYNQIATSTDGKNWTLQGSAGAIPDGFCRAVAWGNGKWVIVGQNFITEIPGRDPLTNRQLRLVTAVVTSTNGTDWTLVNSGGLTNGNAVAYNGSTWVAVGANNRIIASINNAVTWNTRTEQDLRKTLTDVVWNGDYWLVCGRRNFQNNDPAVGIIGKSTDGDVWTFTEHEFIFEKLSWDGNLWFASGINQTLYTSKDGTTWNPKTFFLDNGDPYNISITSFANKIQLPIIGGGINQVVSLVVGYGSPTSVFRTQDNIQWIPQLIDGEGKNFFDKPQKEWNDVIWTGVKWILVGKPYFGESVTTTRTIATSANGKDWNFPHTTSYDLTAVANNESMIIATGTNSKIITSTDSAINWTERTISITTPKCVAWNGSYWLIGGNGGTLKSTNGITWTPSSVCPLSNVNKLAWNGHIWIAGGTGTNHSIALSINGIHWYTANQLTNPFTTCFSIAWNRSLWVAMGEGTNTIATSVDGYNWTGLGTTTFLNSGTSIHWSGTKWIASGNGYYSMAQSTNGTDWSIFDVPITTVNACFNKNILLPYTGTTNSTILTSVNNIVSLITTFTNDSINAEELAAQLAAQLAADAALAAQVAAEKAALRAATKSTASNYRMKILYWKNRVANQTTIFESFKNLNTGLNLELEYPYEYVISNGFSQLLDIFISKIPAAYDEILDDENSQEVLDENLATLKSYADEVDELLVDYFNKTNFLVKEMLTSISSYFMNTTFETKLSDYGFLNNTQKQQVLDFYDTHKTTLLAAITSVQDELDPVITEITYEIDVLNYNYSAQVESGVVLDLNQVSITGTDFINKVPTDTITRTIPVLSGGIGSRTITFSINTLIVTSAPNVHYLYSNTVKLDTENPTAFTYIYTLHTAYDKVYFPLKTKCDNLVEDAVSEALLWNPSADETTIRNSFSQYYEDFFFTLSNNFYIPLTDNLDIAERFFKLRNEYYKNVGAYPTPLGTISTSLSSTISTIDTARNTAVQYALTKKNTTIKNKLQTFLTDIGEKYSGDLEIDTYISDITKNMFYSTSSLEKGKNLKKLAKIGSDLYSQLYPLIFDVKFADLEAEYDGATPPKNGWGTSTNGLTGTDLGSPGLSGWEKFNNTYYTRQKLADFISNRTANGRFISYVGMAETALWKDFLDFTATYNYQKVQDEKTELEEVVSDITSSDSLTTGYIDTIVTSDLATIDARYPIQATTLIDAIKDSVVTKLPSSEDLTTYGGFRYNNSATLQEYVNLINSFYTNLVDVSNIDLSTKTKSEIISLVASARVYKTNIESIQDTNEYTGLLEGIETYKTTLARANTFVELVEDRVDRFVNLKTKYTTSLPFNIDEEIADGSGKSFIAGIVPTNITYWIERTYPVVTLNDQRVELTQPLPALNSSDYAQYSNTQSYRLNDYVVFNSLIYKCINTGKFDGDVSIDLKGISPTSVSYWAQKTYPDVIYEGNEIEASPSLAVPLNYLDFGYYDGNWLYFEGDMVAYEGKIYQCINTVPNISLDASIINIPPTNSQYWQLHTKQLTDYKVSSWNASLLYVPSSVVEYDGYLYKCEQTTLSTGLIPSENPVNWRRIRSYEASVPDEYNSNINYGVNEVVSFRRFDTLLNKNVLYIYICYRIDTVTPELFTYPIFGISDVKDTNGDYKLVKVENGTHNSFYVPRYAPPSNSVDPFRVIGLARGLRRRVAMYVEMPYQWANYLTAGALNDIATQQNNVSALPVKPDNAQTIHSGFISRLNAAIAKFDNNSDMLPTFNNVYASLIEVLRVTLGQVISLRRAVNIMKTQYFNLPPVQTRIYRKPYDYLNPIAEATSGVRQFRDLGVGNLSEIRGELENDETTPELEYYNEKQPKLDDLEEEIFERKLFAETIVGYDMLFQTMNSTQKIGSLIRCDSSRTGIYASIVDFFNDSFFNVPQLEGSPILWYINEIIKESTRPPEYVTDPDLASALTYESSNPIVGGLGKVAKGLVGLTAAAFQAAVPDPFMAFGMLNFISGGAIPNPVQVSWPSFRKEAESRVAYKKQVNIIKDKYKVVETTKQLDGLNDTLIILGALLLYYSELNTDIELNYKPVGETFSYTAQLPNNPPPSYVAPRPAKIDIPNPARVDFTTSIVKEINSLNEQIKDIQNQKAILEQVTIDKPKPLPVKPPIETDIPTTSNKATIANVSSSGGVRKWKIVECNYIGAGAIPIKAGVYEWGNKFATNQIPQPAPAVDTRKPIVGEADVDAALLKQQELEAKYNAAVAEHTKNLNEVEVRKNNLTTNLDNLKEQLAEAELREAYTNARNQNAVLRAREEALMKALEEERIARLEHYKAVQAHRIAVEDSKRLTTQSLIDQAKADIEAKGLKVTETKITFQGRTTSVALTTTQFTEAFDDDFTIHKWVSDRIPDSVKVKYNSVIRRFAPLMAFIRRGQVYLQTRPPARFITNLSNNPKFKKGVAGLGVLAQVAGIGLTAWQDGAFDDE